MRARTISLLVMLRSDVTMDVFFSVSKLQVTWWLFCLLLMVSGSATIHTTLTGAWRAVHGGLVECSWDIKPPDRLFSAQIIRDNDQKVILYRPATHGAKLTETLVMNSDTITSQCWSSNGDTIGSCVLSIRPMTTKLPPISFYTCTVSGETPQFVSDEKEIMLEAFVESSKAHIQSTLDRTRGFVDLNCSSEGMPKPRIKWTVQDNMKDGDIFGESWNDTSKLWHVWSTLRLVGIREDLLVTCTPEQTRELSENVHIGPAADITVTGDSASVYLGTYKNLLAVIILKYILL